jgi:hypothetical protein
VLQTLFDINPKNAIGKIIQRLYALPSPSGADGRVCAWFKANLRWSPVSFEQYNTFFPGSIPALSDADHMGWALFSTDQPNTVDPTLQPTGSYDTVCKTNPLLVAELRWDSYSTLCTAMHYQGPNPQAGDLDAAIAAT